MLTLFSHSTLSTSGKWTWRWEERGENDYKYIVSMIIQRLLKGSLHAGRFAPRILSYQFKKVKNPSKKSWDISLNDGRSMLSIHPYLFKWCQNILSVCRASFKSKAHHAFSKRCDGPKREEESLNVSNSHHSETTERESLFWWWRRFIEVKSPLYEKESWQELSSKWRSLQHSFNTTWGRLSSPFLKHICAHTLWV